MRFTEVDTTLVKGPVAPVFDTGVLITGFIYGNSGPDLQVSDNVCLIMFYYRSFKVSEATMGVEASKLVAIDMLKGLCGGGDEIPLTEDDYLNKNGVIDDEKTEEYLMQEDIEDEVKGKLLIALANMVESSERKRKRDAVEDFQRHRVCAETSVQCRWHAHEQCVLTLPRGGTECVLSARTTHSALLLRAGSLTESPDPVW